MRLACIVLALLAAAEARCASYRDLQMIMEGPWHAASSPAKPQRLGQDQARCRLIAMQTPVTSTTPAVIEAVQWGAEINCMNALGYVSAGQTAPRK